MHGVNRFEYIILEIGVVFPEFPNQELDLSALAPAAAGLAVQVFIVLGKAACAADKT